MVGPVDITRRAAVGVMAAAGAGFVLLGPRGQRDSSGGKLVLDYWEKWTGHEGRAMEAVVRAFNESQSRIHVRYLVTAGVDQKAMIAIGGGSPPDIVGLYNYNIPGYAETGAILPMDGFDSPLAPRRERYAAAVWPILTHPDREGRERVWGVPNTGGTVALYYNRAAFRGVGLDPDRPPRTIQELDEMSAKLDVVDADGTIRRAGFMHSEPGWWQWFWGFYFGGTLYDREGNTSRIGDEANVRAFEWLARRGRRLGAKAADRFKSGFASAYDSPLNAFLDGKVAMVLQGPWLANVIGMHKPDLDYGVTPMPVDAAILRPGEPVGLVESDVLVIPRGVRRPEACMEFIAYTQRPDVAELLARAHFKNSVMRDVSPEFLSTHPNRGVATHNAIANSPGGFLAPRTRAWLEIKAMFDEGVPKIWNLSDPPREALGRIHERAQAALDRVAASARRRGQVKAQGAS